MNKNRLFIVITVLFSLNLFYGCGTIKQDVYLQNVEVSGPINQPPLAITKDLKAGTLTISPKIYFYNTRRVTAQVNSHTKVDQDGVFQVDTIFNNNGSFYYKASGADSIEFKGSNLEWNFPAFSTGLQLDACITNHFALNGSINLAIQDHEKILNGSLGMGFFTEKNGKGVRFDVGILWQSFYYDASSVVITTQQDIFGNNTNSQAEFFRDQNKSHFLNFYGRLTLNSANQNSIFDYFFSLSYFGQRLMTFTPASINPAYYPGYIIESAPGTETDVTTSFIGLLPGLIANLGVGSKLDIGINVLQELEFNKASRSLYIVPMVQYDMQF